MERGLFLRSEPELLALDLAGDGVSLKRDKLLVEATRSCNMRCSSGTTGMGKLSAVAAWVLRSLATVTDRKGWDKLGGPW
jgi:hypothetical protein